MKTTLVVIAIIFLAACAWASPKGRFDTIRVDNVIVFSDNTTQTTAASASTTTVAVTYVIDGGGSTITTGEKGHLLIPFAGTITQVYAIADQIGTIIVSIWKDTYANYPPTVADNITASAPVTIGNAVKSFDNTLTGWTTSIASGDILAYNVDNVTAIQRVTISLVVEK